MHLEKTKCCRAEGGETQSLPDGGPSRDKKKVLHSSLGLGSRLRRGTRAENDTRVGGKNERGLTQNVGGGGGDMVQTTGGPVKIRV